MHQTQTELALIGFLFKVSGTSDLISKTSYLISEQSINYVMKRVKFKVSLQRSFPRPSLCQLNKLLMSSSREIIVSAQELCPLESQLLSLPFSCRTYPLHHVFLSSNHAMLLNYKWISNYKYKLSSYKHFLSQYSVQVGTYPHIMERVLEENQKTLA